MYLLRGTPNSQKRNCSAQSSDSSHEISNFLNGPNFLCLCIHRVPLNFQVSPAGSWVERKDRDSNFSQTGDFILKKVNLVSLHPKKTLYVLRCYSFYKHRWKNLTIHLCPQVCNNWRGLYRTCLLAIAWYTSVYPLTGLILKHVGISNVKYCVLYRFSSYTISSHPPFHHFIVSKFTFEKLISTTDFIKF